MTLSLVKQENWLTFGLNSIGKTKKCDVTCARHMSFKASLLVHSIDGWIIEESSKPFKEPTEVQNEVLVQPDEQTEEIHQENNTQERPSEEKDELMSLLPTTCKHCGGPLPQKQAMWGKRFCSISCSKRYSVNCTNRVRKAMQNKKQQATTPKRRASRSKESRKSPCSTSQSPADQNDDLLNKLEFPSRHTLGYGLVIEDIENELYDGVEPIQNYAFLPLVNWSIAEVVDYISGIPGCEQYMSAFEAEEIDGQALLLLKIEHMVHAMHLKLGPALKIAANVRAIKAQYGVHTTCKYLSSP